MDKSVSEGDAQSQVIGHINTSLNKLFEDLKNNSKSEMDRIDLSLSASTEAAEKRLNAIQEAFEQKAADANKVSRQNNDALVALINKQNEVLSTQAQSIVDLTSNLASVKSELLEIINQQRITTDEFNKTITADVGNVLTQVKADIADSNASFNENFNNALAAVNVELLEVKTKQALFADVANSMVSDITDGKEDIMNALEGVQNLTPFVNALKDIQPAIDELKALSGVNAKTVSDLHVINTNMLSVAKSVQDSADKAHAVPGQIQVESAALDTRLKSTSNALNASAQSIFNGIKTAVNDGNKVIVESAKSVGDTLIKNLNKEIKGAEVVVSDVIKLADELNSAGGNVAIAAQKISVQGGVVLENVRSILAETDTSVTTINANLNRVESSSSKLLKVSDETIEALTNLASIVKEGD